MEPWFYESRFLRPRFARQAILETLRRLSSAGSLSTASSALEPPLRELETDVLVVGGGPSGLAAAAIAGSATTTTLVTRASAGGSLPRDSVVARRVADDLLRCRSSARVLENSFCIGRYEEEGSFIVLSPEGPLAIRASRCIVATGAYDRPLLLKGSDLPGVIGLRSFQLLASQAALGGRSIGVVGGAVELARATETARAFGIRLAWTMGPGTSTVEAVPLRSIAGRRRARGVEFVDGRRLSSDLVVIATTQPTYELQIQLGSIPRFEGNPLVVRADAPEQFPTLVVGEAAGWSDVHDAAERAAEATHGWLEQGISSGVEDASIEDIPVASMPDAVVCACEDVRRHDLHRAIDDGFDDVDLVKRRSGAATGACQGKLCLALIAEVFVEMGLSPTLPTIRPPIRPVRISALGGAE